MKVTLKVYAKVKESKFRFNYGPPSHQLKTLRKWCDISSLSTTASILMNLKLPKKGKVNGASNCKHC